MARVVLVAVVLAGWAGTALAEAPASSLRPAARPVAVVAPLATPEPVVAPTATSPRPKARPASAPVASMPAPSAPVPTASVALAAPSSRPQPRPAGLAPAAAAQTPTVYVLKVAAAGPNTPRPKPRPTVESPPAQPEIVTASAAAPAPERRGGLAGLFGGSRKRDPAPKSGYVCGDPDIRGEELARITSKTKGCGIEDPVRVVAVDGIRLSTPATIDCTTASALKAWLRQGLRPAFKSREIVEIQIAASYICRPRNNQRGNKISEHGRGKAVDISGIVFSDGKVITVAQNYGRELRRAHKAACGIFGTTLGPGSDGYHEDHLHFDTAGYRSGPYCR